MRTLNTNGVCKALCLVAHPDDESLFAGATLYSLSRVKIDVTVAALTCGESRFEGTLLDLATKRKIVKSEFLAACCVLNVKPLLFFNRDVNSLTDADLIAFDVSIAEAISLTRPDVILTHGSSGEYGSESHLAVHNLLLSRFRARNCRWKMWTFRASRQVQNSVEKWTNNNDTASFRVNIHSVKDIKRKAIESYKSMQYEFNRIYAPLSPLYALGRCEYWHVVAR